MRILVACEFSQAVTKAFRSNGHEAYSCDILPTEGNPEWHIQDDVLNRLNDGWDMLIAHPPCTDLAVSGAAHFARKRASGEQQRSVEFFMQFTRTDIPKVAIENPVSIMSTLYRKPDQIIQPFWFGEHISKKTCLWLKNLPVLVPTNFVNPKTYACKCGCRFDYQLGKYGCPNCRGDSGPARLVYENQTKSGQNNMGPSPTRGLERSRFPVGIAEAMATQWGSLDDIE